MPNLWVTPDEMESEANSPFAYEAAKTASFILWALSGRKYAGTHTVVEQYDCPCGSNNRHIPARMLNEPGLFAIEPYLIDGAMVNMASGNCTCAGSINGVHTRLRLKQRPVRSVQRVVAGGEELDSGQYQVVNSTYLQAAPGNSINFCGAEVTYTCGVEPPTAGRRAARHLAQEFAKGWGGGECELPERVTSVSRQGVSYTILDDQAFLDDMRTGVYAVDLFLKAVNPDKARKPARVFSPDIARASRVTSSRQTPVGPWDLTIAVGEPYTWSIPLGEINGDVLTQDDWAPNGQISSWNGATLLEFDDSRFVISGNTLRLDLTPEETGRITGDGAFDLYAVNQLDGFTVIHLLTSTVRTMSV